MPHTERVRTVTSGWSTDTREAYNQATEYELPPIGVYQFELVEKGEDQPVAEQFDPTGTKRRARFQFQIVDDEDWEGAKIGVFYNLSLNEKSYFLPVVEALLGRTLGATERVGWEDDASQGVVGIGHRRMMGTLKHDVKQDGRTFGRIESPFPIRTSKGSKAKAAPTITEAPELSDVPF